MLYIVMFVAVQDINFVKPREVAELLKLNTLTIYKYICQGKLRAVRFGRTYRIHEKDLEAFIEEHATKK